MSEGVDKREHHRFIARLEVRALPGDKVPSDLVLATLDMAVGGARCSSNLPVPEETHIQLTVTLVGGELRAPTPIDVESKVRRCHENPEAIPIRRYELALEFVRIDPQDRRLLQNYLNAL